MARRRTAHGQRRAPEPARTSAVTFNCHPGVRKAANQVERDSLRVFVTGILTYTLSPQEAISRAWRSIS